MMDSVVEMVSALVTEGLGFKVIDNLLNHILGFILKPCQFDFT